MLSISIVALIKAVPELNSAIPGAEAEKGLIRAVIGGAQGKKLKILAGNRKLFGDGKVRAEGEISIALIVIDRGDHGVISGLCGRLRDSRVTGGTHFDVRIADRQIIHVSADGRGVRLVAEGPALDVHRHAGQIPQDPDRQRLAVGNGNKIRGVALDTVVDLIDAGVCGHRGREQLVFGISEAVVHGERARRVYLGVRHKGLRPAGIRQICLA